MATVEVKTEETRCDRCSRKVTASGARRSLENGTLVEVLRRVEGDMSGVDLCVGCSRSLDKWWSRGKADGE